MNNIHKGEIDSNVEKALISRSVNKNLISYPKHNVHVYAKNSPVREHYRERLNKLNGPLILLM